MLTNFDLRVSLNVDSLRAEIVGEFPKCTRYYFYLIKDGVVLRRDGWQIEASFSWRLSKSGSYKIRGFVDDGINKKTKFSNTIRYSDEETIRELDLYMSRDDNIFNLPFYSLSEPHQDLALIFGFETQHLEFRGLKSTYRHSLNLPCRVLHSRIVGVVNADVILSGVAFFNDRLIFGQDDLEGFDGKNVRGCTGDFVAVSFRDNEICITHDYFGIQKVYFYLADGKLIASNRLHLLLLIMAALEIPMRMDVDQTIGCLASGYSQPFQQLISNSLVVAGTKMLSIDEEIVVTTNGASVRKTSLAATLESATRQRVAVDDLEYMRLVEVGVREVLSQARAVLQHPRFKNVVVDATGGMDSRAIIAAITNFPEHWGRIVINACDTPTIKNDIRVASAITDFISAPYDALDETSCSIEIRARQDRLLSLLLGTYYAYNTLNMDSLITCRDDAINVTGFFGEICLRPYYSRSYLEADFGRTTDFDTFFEALSGENHVSVGRKQEIELFEKVYKESLAGMPGDSPIEKYDLFYLFFRNGLHCSDSFRFSNETPRIGILQSPTLFRLKCLLYGRSPATLLQNDIISRLNPALLAFPYASERDNNDLNCVRSKLSFLPPYLHHARIKNLPDGKAPEVARSTKKVCAIDVDASFTPSDTGDLVESAKRALAILILKAKLIDKEFGLLLLAEIRESPMRHVMINKVLMVYFQWSLTQMSRDSALEGLEPRKFVEFCELLSKRDAAY